MMDRREQMHQYGGLPSGTKFDRKRMKLVATLPGYDEDEGIDFEEEERF